jgi:hypothetical protein
MNGSPTPSDRSFQAFASSPAFDTLTHEELLPELVTLRDARQRAADIRLAAERALREAQAAEAQLLAQEEQAVAAAEAVKRERWTEIARSAAAAERVARETLSALHLQTQRAASTKALMEAAVAELRHALSEREEQLLAAERDEHRLLADIAAAERRALECSHARDRAAAALQTLTLDVREDSAPTAPAPSTSEIHSPQSLASQRMAERRAADALRMSQRMADGARTSSV